MFQTAATQHIVELNQGSYRNCGWCMSRRFGQNDTARHSAGSETALVVVSDGNDLYHIQSDAARLLLGQRLCT